MNKGGRGRNGQRTGREEWIGEREGGMNKGRGGRNEQGKVREE
jgi:hypothetical protein